jgi:hypothetical protein
MVKSSGASAMAWSKCARPHRPTVAAQLGDAELDPGPLLVVGRWHLVGPHVVGVAQGNLSS